MVSGAQSSSSSSMSAHFDSLPSPSAWILDVIWMPYCCLSSSSVRCLVDVWGVTTDKLAPGNATPENPLYPCSCSKPAWDPVLYHSYRLTLSFWQSSRARWSIWLRGEAEILVQVN